EPALLHELADDLEHRVALDLVGRLELGEQAPVLHGEVERRRRGDAGMARGLRRARVLEDRALVGDSLGEVRHRPPLDGHLPRAGGLADHARVDGHALLQSVAPCVLGTVSGALAPESVPRTHGIGWVGWRTGRYRTLT